ncbi:putative UPF0481 protein At3g02645 [Alnus glutinosa]|uniref:putative UPF0481 protein At3g02645 n=1 Tax=Alnus glutinosa TaxID=3517 RepID=UPI002D7A1C9F|nr:putative UPF0481 protein At3g02645 [Alnus glutinosa]
MAHHAILRDIIMLENQIPLFLLREVHKFYLLHEDHDQALATMLMGFCKDLSPIKYINYQHISEECFERAHLLELLYHMVAPKLQLVLDYLTAVLYLSLPSFFSTDVVSTSGRVQESFLKEELSPLVEEFAIPSLTQLHKVGVKFRPTKGGLESINFDKCCGKFYLPVIHLDDNLEVVLWNLVAYEACIAPEVMVFTRYMELMNGIIDSEEDVRILREAGIILNRLKSNEEVATLWNGITKSVRVTKVPILDKAIEGANTYYSGSCKVRMNVAMKKYVFGSWPCLTFLAANILILLSTLQAACTMYNCSKIFKAL